jgi:hypothetical protein
MRLLERVAAEQAAPRRRGRKSWSEPPFWALDRFRHGLLSQYQPERERIENDFEGYVEGAYKQCGIVFACILTRHLVFSQAPLMFQQLDRGKPVRLFSNPSLDLLRKPWTNATTADLLTRMEIDVSLAGNFYATLADDQGRIGKAATGPGQRISPLRPDWITIIVGSRTGDPRAADAHPVGYIYEPPSTGRGVQSTPVLLMPDEVCHYIQDPDPTARYRGMSWLTPVLREIAGDRAATTHKLRFFECGTQLGTIVTLDKDVSVEDFDEFVDRFLAQHEGADNAYKTLALGGGADVTVVGSNLVQADFKVTQGAGETRIAAASGVGAIVAQFSEGMQGSSLNAGNYGAARRRAADVLFRRLWQAAASRLEVFAPPPAPGVRLWYDEAQISFLQEDEQDAADIQYKKSQTIRNLTDAGFEPRSVVDAVEADDYSKLRHTGLFSVQLQPPMTEQRALPAPSTNGNGDGRVLEEV